MSDIAFSCPNCGGGLVVDSSGAGFEVSCPRCSAKIKIPKTKSADVVPPNAMVQTPRRTSPILIWALVCLFVLCAGLGGWVFALTRAPSSSGESNQASSGSLLRKVANTVLPDIQLNGEVFIVTRGGQNIKLGLVTISLMSLESLEPVLSTKQEAAKKVLAKELARLEPLIEAAKSEEARFEAEAKQHERATYGAGLAAWKEANSKSIEAREKRLALERERDQFRSQFVSGEYYFKALPTPLATTKTDGDGKFEITVPHVGNFALAASASRLTGEKFEKYYWLVRLDGQSAQNRKVMLSNDNLTSSRSPVSLIATED